MVYIATCTVFISKQPPLPHTHTSTTTTTTTKIPPHSASCPSASPVFAPVGGRKNTTGASCNRWNYRRCKWSLCANGWGRNTTTLSCCQWQPPQAQGAKVRNSISASRNGMQQQHATPTTTTLSQLRISTRVGGVHNAAISVTCARAGPGGNCVPLRKLQWLLHCALHQRWCWLWAGRWWWWLELHDVAQYHCYIDVITVILHCCTYYIAASVTAKCKG